MTNKQELDKMIARSLWLNKMIARSLCVESALDYVQKAIESLNLALEIDLQWGKEPVKNAIYHINKAKFFTEMYITDTERMESK